MKLRVSITILVLILGGLTWWMLRGSNSGKIRKELTLHIPDTAAIHQIDILDREGNRQVLERQKSGWMINGESARTHAVNNLLATIHNQRVSALIPTSALDNVVRDLSSNGVRFDVKGKNGNSMMVFYVGGVTPDERGTFMIREDSEWPVIVNIPGFEGSLRSRYIMSSNEWKSRRIFEPVQTIHSLTVDYPSRQDQSFILEKTEEGYTVKPFYESSARPVTVHPYLVEAYRDQLNKLFAEAVLDESKRSVLDASIPFCTLIVTNGNGETQKLEFYPTVWIDYLEDVPSTQNVERYYTDSNDQTIFLTQHLLMQNIFTGYEHFVSLKGFGTQK